MNRKITVSRCVQQVSPFTPVDLQQTPAVPVADSLWLPEDV